MALRALTLREGTAPIRERLVMTIFVAALLHGMVILGITFSSAAHDGNSSPGLEVLLVSDEVPTADRNDSATYLAQRTQLGSGNTDRHVSPRNQAAAQPIAAHDGLIDGNSLTASGAAASPHAERVLATATPRPQIEYFSDSGFGAAGSEKPLLLPDRVAADAGPDDDTGQVELRGPRREDLWVTPDTRQSILAPYLDHWRRRVEQIGTLNYPTAARSAGLDANPVLEVVIGSDGRLERAVIRHSSGDAALDQAALAILKLASPFDPFPPELARDYRMLRFAYQWDFVGGRPVGGTVSAVP